MSMRMFLLFSICSFSFQTSFALFHFGWFNQKARRKCVCASFACLSFLIMCLIDSQFLAYYLLLLNFVYDMIWCTVDEIRGSRYEWCVCIYYFYQPTNADTYTMLFSVQVNKLLCLPLPIAIIPQIIFLSMYISSTHTHDIGCHRELDPKK